MKFKVDIDEKQLIEILAIYAENNVTGFDILKNFIAITATNHVLINIKQLKEQIII